MSRDGALAEALARAVFVLGAHDGLALLTRFPETWGVVACPGDAGVLTLSVSQGHGDAFHPASGAGAATAVTLER